MKRTIKKRGALWLTALFFLFLLLPVQAREQKVTDGADLLTAAEEAALQERLEKIAEKYECDLAVATTDSCGGRTIQEYTDDYYEDAEYGFGEEKDGIILMVSMAERQFHMATRGKAIRIFTDYGMERIDELITGDLSEGDYSGAFFKFADLAEEFMREAEENEPYDVNHTYRKPMAWWLRLAVAAGGGLMTAVLVMLVLIRQLRSVAPAYHAGDYVRKGSFHVTGARDIFLYRTVTKRKIEKKSGGSGGSTTHSTGGGGRAGGHTGSF